MVRGEFRATSVTMTVAPAIAPPLWSVTAPRIRPAVPCANSGALLNNDNTNANTKIVDAIFHLAEKVTTGFIGPTLLDLFYSRGELENIARSCGYASAWSIATARIHHNLPPKATQNQNAQKPRFLKDHNT